MRLPLTTLLRQPALAASAAALAVAAGAALIDAREDLGYARQQRIALGEAIGALGDRIAQQMNLYMGACYSAEAMLAAYPQVDAAAFQALSRTLVQRLPALAYIELAPDAVVQHSFPLEAGPAAVGLDLRRDLPPKAVALVEETIREGQLRVVGPGVLAQGGQGIVARNPLYFGKGEARRFWGFATIIIDYDKFIAGFPQLVDDRQIEYALRGMDGLGESGGVFLGRADLFDGDSSVRRIEFPNGGWLLAAQPRGGWPEHRPTAALFRTLAALLALGVGGLTWMVRQRGEALRRLATTDALTGTLARAQFTTVAHSEIARALRNRRPLALLMFDIDHFKQVNDGHGHATGDAVLRALAGRMRRLVREGSLVGRLGGEEFAVLAPETDAAQALELAERIRQAVAATPVVHDGMALRCTISGGLACLDDDSRSLDALLAKADQALYRAKAEGRDRIIAS